jgi:hypothetical protein
MKAKDVIVLGCTLASLLCFQVVAAEAQDQGRPTNTTAGSSPNAGRLKTGIFTYRDLDHGNEVGRGAITIRKLTDSGRYAFSNDSTFAADFSGFRSQRWEATATPTFEPISATLAFIRGSEIVPVLDLQYGSNRVTGFVVERKGPASGTKRPVDAPVPVNTVDQRIDWAAVLAGNLETGQEFEFNVYDPSTGVSRVAGRVGPLEQVRVPAGSFRAYRIIYQMEKAGTTEHYQMLASQDLPRVMLREEFPNGVFTELIQITEPASP